MEAVAITAATAASVSSPTVTQHRAEFFVPRLNELETIAKELSKTDNMPVMPTG